MTIEKAIEILQHHGLCPDDTTWGDYLDAVNLGKEALARILKERAVAAGQDWGHLPSETQE